MAELTPRVPLLFLGTTQFAVRYEPSLADEGILGRIALLQNVIELRPNMSEYMEQQTLLHEALHAILFLGGIKQHDDQHQECTSDEGLRDGKDHCPSGWSHTGQGSGTFCQLRQAGAGGPCLRSGRGRDVQSRHREERSTSCDCCGPGCDLVVRDGQQDGSAR